MREDLKISSESPRQSASETMRDTRRSLAADRDLIIESFRRGDLPPRTFRELLCEALGDEGAALAAAEIEKRAKKD